MSSIHIFNKRNISRVCALDRSRTFADWLPKARSYKNNNSRKPVNIKAPPQKRHKSKTKGSESRRDTALVARCSENCVFAWEMWFWQLKKTKAQKKAMLVWKSQWLSGKSSASQDGRLPVRVRRGHWSVEEGVGGAGEESGDAPGTGGTGGRWRSSRICQDREENKKRLCFKSKYLLLNNTFFSSLYFSYLLSPSIFSFSGTRSSVRRLLSCFAAPCFSAQAGIRTAVFHMEGCDLTTEPLGLSH